MRARCTVPLVLIFGALLWLQPATAGSAIATPPQVDLGYSPTTLTPASSGVPVYTYGDSMWVMPSSQNSYSIQLFSPDGIIIAAGETSPGAPILLHTFASADVPGVWTLSLRVAGSSAIQQVSVLLSQVPPIQLDMTGSSISSSGVLTMNYTVASVTTAHDLSACAFGSPLPGIVSAPIPSSLGSGSVLLTLNGSNVVIAPNPHASTVTNPFDLWVELYQNYSYTEAGGVSIMVERDVQVAASAAVPLSSGTSSTTAPFAPTTSPRPGMFDLRIFFDSSHGFYADQAPVLITNASTGWISLQGCGSTHQPSADVFTISSKLTQNTSLWPTQVFLTYQEDGVGGYSQTYVQVLPSAVTVVAAPWGTSFNDTELTIAPGPGVQSSASVNGTFFLVASHYPIEVGISLTSGGPTQQVAVRLPYYYTKAEVNASKLVVAARVGAQGPAAPGTNITIASSEGVLAKGDTNSTGLAVFYVPGGRYNVTGEYANATELISAVSAVPREATQLTLTFPGHSDPFATILLISGAIGVAASIFTWVAVYRSRRGDLASLDSGRHP